LKLQVLEVSDTAVVGTKEKFANENHWNLVSSWHRATEPDILLEVNCWGYLPSRRYEKHTCNRRVNKALKMTTIKDEY